MTDDLLLLPSITDVDAGHRARVVVSGSHGGLYPGYLAAKAGLRAVILNDAGGGLERAGTAGIHALDKAGMAAAAVSHLSARIGDAQDMMARGVVSTANAAAAGLGVTVGMTCAEAAQCLAGAPVPAAPLPPVDEARRVVPWDGGPDVVLADSASQVGAEDKGRIVITGSHGGLVGGDPARALKTAAALAVFNDAGGGIEDAGLTRLPALDARAIPAVTVAHTSARIGDAASAWETGVISHANGAAMSLGAQTGAALRGWIAKALP
ncbi:MAG: hypothetical protein CMM77_09145 [Rhodospirillaceae bacterium]|nr:hypothetical protein [Magnetovibrio sp.]MAY67280.1 hypothetical protein [Rhodospirillaceae bacterium]